MKPTFPNLALLVSMRRKQVGITQTSLGHQLGYENSGQYISNIEHAICSIPPKKITKLATLIDTLPREIIEAILKDYELYLINEINISNIKDVNNVQTI